MSDHVEEGARGLADGRERCSAGCRQASSLLELLRIEAFRRGCGDIRFSIAVRRAVETGEPLCRP